MPVIYLLLGGNMGDRERYLSNARNQISLQIGQLLAVSSLFETQPWGFENGNPFLNQLVKAKTRMEPVQALNTILGIEEFLGREREGKKYSSRSIDIDILFYDDKVISEKNLVIPHPELQNRRFALEPLVELDPDLTHPVLKKTMRQLLAECSDKMEVKKLQKP